MQKYQRWNVLITFYKRIHDITGDTNLDHLAVKCLCYEVIISPFHTLFFRRQSQSPAHIQKRRIFSNYKWFFLIKKARHWIFGIFFIFIHMTRFYTKNSQLNSTNLHSWGMLKKNSTKKNPAFGDPRFNILQCRGEGSWGKHPKVSPKRNDLNFTFPLHIGSKWWECNLQFIFFRCRFLWK